MNNLDTTPKRALTSNFTKRTLQRSRLAKKRLERKRWLKGLFTMQKIGFLKHPAGALLAIALIAVSGAGVYAAMNWFNGDIKVTSDNSVMTVDLSKCNSNMPPGVEPTTDRKNVKFKITGSPHIEARELERKLLINCEFDAVLTFYQATFGKTVGMSPALVKHVDAKSNTVTLALKFGGANLEKTVTMNSAAVIRDKGEVASLTRFAPGDYVIFAYLRDSHMSMMENEDPFKDLSSIDGIFKTQYDTREFLEEAKSFYSSNNIMPLDQYNKLNKR